MKPSARSSSSAMYVGALQMRVPVGMRTVVVSGGASWAKDSPRPRRLATPANDTDARKSRRLWNLCMTLPRVELSQLFLARRDFVDRFASDQWHARVYMAGYRISECQSAGNSSALGQTRSFGDIGSMSELPSKAVAERTSVHGSKVSQAAVSNRSKAARTT